MTKRQPVSIRRTTTETDVEVKLLLDGGRQIHVETGVGFFDHMITSLAFWAGWDLNLSCKGDLQVDIHHTVEDVALALGQAFAQARKDAGEVERFAAVFVPLDEALTQVVIDLSGRPYWVFDAELKSERTRGT